MKLKIYEDLKQEVLNCNKCGLCEDGKINEFRAQVMGQGNLEAKIMFVAQNPGAEEVKNQQPLTSTGKSGKVYDKILQILNLNRSDVYTTNVVACHSPDNREPEIYEIDKCNSYLHRQIQLVNPKLIITFGRLAAQNFINDLKITIDHGRIQRNNKYNIDIFPMYHPSYISAYAPQNTRKEFYEDLEKLKGKIKIYVNEGNTNIVNDNNVIQSRY